MGLLEQVQQKQQALVPRKYLGLNFKRKRAAYKLHAGVVDEEVLNFDPPVWPEFEVPAALRRVAHVAPPGVRVFDLVKVPRVNQHVQAVLTEAPARPTEDGL